MKNKKIKYLTLLGSLGLATGVGAQVYLCQQCPKDTYSNGRQCISCGFWEYSDVGSSSCTKLKYKIDNIIQEFTEGGLEAYGYLDPGFYVVILGGGNGGAVRSGPYTNSQGKGARLQYVFKVTQKTSYTIASGEDGDADDESCSATGGGGGSWFKLDDTYYVAGGGGGSNSYNCEMRSSVGGWGGGIGGGGGGGDAYGHATGQKGGASGHYKGGKLGSGDRAGGNGEGIGGESGGGYGGDVDRSASCHNEENAKDHNYGGRGGYLSSNGDCAPGSYYDTKVNEFVIHGGDGKTSHDSNTSKFDNKLCYHCAKLYKLK